MNRASEKAIESNRSFLQVNNDFLQINRETMFHI